MGVAERDWYSDRQRPGRRGEPPGGRRHWHPVVVLIVVVSLFIIGTKFDRWLTEKAPAFRVPERVRALLPRSDPPAGRQAEPARPQADQPAPAPAETARTMT